ncbi:polymorphic toxin type 27 domain-containing protein [Streptomyces cyaneofuscatus]|uniref:polymorphic toxin type 27 domain-containing protein n=1 Tax=Streptomyces cyaneofuscatus TaxID=66883 RepID=UPI003F540A53
MRSRPPGTPRHPGWASRLTGRLLPPVLALALLAVAGAGDGYSAPPTVPAASYDWYEETAAELLRQDQCLMSDVGRLGGPSMAATAKDGLNQTPERLRELADRNYWRDTPLGAAYQKDKDLANVELSRLHALRDSWDIVGLETPGGFKSVADFEWPPGGPGDDRDDFHSQTGLLSWIADRFWKTESDFYEDATPKADDQTVAKVKALGQPLYGGDPDPTKPWDLQLAQESAYEHLTNWSLEPTGADDARIFLASGGFPDKAPVPGTAEHRIAVEDLKSRYAACAWRDPIDPAKVLGEVSATAAAEWQKEITSQAGPRNAILSISASTTSSLAAGSEAMGQLLGHSWVADHITRWQDYWSSGGIGWIGTSPMTIQIPGASGKCLGVQGSGTANGTAVEVVTCSTAAAQQWRFNGGYGENGYSLQNVNSNKCLDVASNQTKIQIWACDGTPKQVWKFGVRANTTLENTSVKKCLNFPAYTAGQDALAAACSTAATQKVLFKVSGHNGSVPPAAQFTKASQRLTAARNGAKAELEKLKEVAEFARLDTVFITGNQDRAYAIADAAGAPRGRGLLMGQQKVQVTQGAAAALAALVKAGETAEAATRASAADSATIAQRALAQAAQSKAEFRKKAAETAELQAKAAMDAAKLHRDNARKDKETAEAKLAVALTEESKAKAAAAAAHAKRLEAEAEEATAKKEKATADAKKAEAARHRQTAEAEAVKAEQAKTSAETAEKTAVARKKDAESARDRARELRDDAWDAEQKANAARAKADAKAAYAASLDAGQAADDARAAADKADRHADDAEAAAGRSRSAANAATQAAADADAAATRAEAAAKRSRAAADDAQAEKLKADAAVRTATSAAADAIDASERAAASAGLSVKAANDAEAKAKEARTQANLAQAEADKATAASAKAAGFAYVTAQAAADAGNSAAQVAKPANDAIQLGSPYVTKDSAASLVVLSGQAAKTIAEQQKAVADAHAANAAEEAQAAQLIADLAQGDAKAAYQHAANAAKYAAEARGYSKEALNHAAAAATAAAKAQQSLARSIGYAAQAATDAAAADGAAGRAEGHAKEARTSADEAALDADAARAAATRAEDSARDARAAAERADIAATAAEEAAKDAQKFAESAQEAARQAESAGNAGQIETGTVPDATGRSIGRVFYTIDRIEQVGKPKVLKKTDGCDGWWDELVYKGDCTMTQEIGYKAELDLYLCSVEVFDNTCFSSDTFYLGEIKTDKLTTEVTHTITIAEYQQGVDPIDILFGSWIRCAQALTPGGENGSWGGCVWAAVDVASLFAGKIIRPIADAVTAMDAALKTGIAFTSAWKALRTVGLSEVAIQGIISRIVQKLAEVCDKLESKTFRVSVSATRSSGVNDCTKTFLSDLVKDGDHIVLGVNPGSDDLAKAVGGYTFNGKAYADELSESLGLGIRPLWTVGVEQAVSKANVKISVSLDGVAGAKSADEALDLLLERGATIKAGDWATIRSNGFGTAWEMIKLRTAVRMEQRTWKSIRWYRTNGDNKVVEVFPKRFTYDNGTPVPE